MPGFPAIPFALQFFDDAGDPLSGGFLHTYVAGSVSTPKTTYIDALLGTPNANPIVLDGAGRCHVFLADGESYKYKLTNSAGVEIDTEDNVKSPQTPTATSIAALLWPQSAAESAASVVPDVLVNRIIMTPYRHNGVGDGAANDTQPVKDALAAVSAVGNGSILDLAGGNFLVGTIKFDKSNIVIRGGKLTAHSSIPAAGAILLSLAGGADTATNQALLDGIYGAGVQTVRTVVSGSLENVHIDDVQFVGGANAVKGVWATGFTRGCRIWGSYFDNCDDHGICLNGSWSFSLLANHISGDGTNGTGIGLGQTGLGTRSGSSVVNGPTLIGNEVTACANGGIWNFGAGGKVSGNTWELNAVDGFRSQSVAGVSYTGNYHENNAGDNLQPGGTNGSDFCIGWTVTGNHFAMTVAAGGNNIRLQGMQRCHVHSNNFTGDKTQWYFIAAGIGQYITDCDIETPDLSGTYISNASTEANAAYNDFHNGKRKKFINQQNAAYTFTINDPAQIVYKDSGAAVTWTLPSNASVPMPVGTVIECVNNDAADAVTLGITTDTLVGSTTLAAATRCLLTKVATTVWMRS